MERNIMVGDYGGSVLVLNDTLHEKNGDYIEVARIEKETGAIKWSIQKGLDTENANLSDHENFKGTVREVVERWSEIEKKAFM